MLVSIDDQQVKSGFHESQFAMEGIPDVGVSESDESTLGYAMATIARVESEIQDTVYGLLEQLGIVDEWWVQYLLGVFQGAWFAVAHDVPELIDLGLGVGGYLLNKLNEAGRALTHMVSDLAGLTTSERLREKVAKAYMEPVADSGPGFFAGALSALREQISSVHPDLSDYVHQEVSQYVDPEDGIERYNHLHQSRIVGHYTGWTLAFAFGALATGGGLLVAKAGFLGPKLRSFRGMLSWVRGVADSRAKPLIADVVEEMKGKRWALDAGGALSAWHGSSAGVLMQDFYNWSRGAGAALLRSLSRYLVLNREGFFKLAHGIMAKNPGLDAARIWERLRDDVLPLMARSMERMDLPWTQRLVEYSFELYSHGGPTAYSDLRRLMTQVERYANHSPSPRDFALQGRLPWESGGYAMDPFAVVIRDLGAINEYSPEAARAILSNAQWAGRWASRSPNAAFELRSLATLVDLINEGTIEAMHVHIPWGRPGNALAEWEGGFVEYVSGNPAYKYLDAKIFDTPFNMNDMELLHRGINRNRHALLEAGHASLEDAAGLEFWFHELPDVVNGMPIADHVMQQARIFGYGGARVIRRGKLFAISFDPASNGWPPIDPSRLPLPTRRS